MPYTFEDYEKDYVRRHLHSLTPEELLEDLSADEKFRNAMKDAMFRMTPADEMLESIPIQKVVNFLSKANKKALMEIMKKMSSES